MHTLPYFYLPPQAWGDEVLLEGQEAAHLRQVLRVQEGARVALLDGEGRSGCFLVEKAYKKEVRLRCESSETHPEPVSKPYIALALSKAVRRSFFMEKAVELGASAILLWQGDYSQGKIQPQLEETLIRQMIAGAKQSHNPWLPRIYLYPEGLGELLKATEDIHNRILPWELHTSSDMLNLSHIGKEGKTLYVIGPEGGFSQSELDLLDAANFVRVSLGPRVLRCETAAVLCLGLHWWAQHLSWAK